MLGRFIGAYRITSGSDTTIDETLLTFADKGDTLLLAFIGNSSTGVIVVAQLGNGAAPAACPDPSTSMAEGAAASGQITGTDIFRVMSRDGAGPIVVPLRAAGGGSRLADQVRVRAFVHTAVSGNLVVALFRRDEQPA